MSTNNEGPRPHRPLSEISHLFLSSIRETAGENRSRPVRLPPGADRNTEPKPTPDVGETQRRRVTAVIGAHLNGDLLDRAGQFASRLASSGERVGLIYLDSSEVRLQIADNEPAGDDLNDVCETIDTRHLSETMLELNHDIGRWLLVLADPRKPEARTLLHRVDDWLLLSTCDHDGVVSGYRTLKGLAEGPKEPLSIALVDAPSTDQADRVFNKLAGVCRQFLDWDVRFEGTASTDVERSVVTVLWSRCARDKAQLATAPHWRAVDDFLQLPPDARADEAHYGTAYSSFESEAAFESEPQTEPMKANEPASVVDPHVVEVLEARAVAMKPMNAMKSINLNSAEPVMTIKPTNNSEPRSTDSAYDTHAAPAMFPAASQSTATVADYSDVIDLPEGVSVLSAVMRQGGDLLATPLSAPMCPGATVAVGRDRGVVLVAQAGTGLSGMDAIAAAIRWLDDSKQLIAMAMPQLSIEASIPSRVYLLIDHADHTADGIKPLLGNSRITIRSYRKLRWAGRTGLLLDAA
jgi:hypothetical protein